jgi:hypothetical protein
MRYDSTLERFAHAPSDVRFMYSFPRALGVPLVKGRRSLWNACAVRCMVYVYWHVYSTALIIACFGALCFTL